ncbi:hypothetical protein DASC09_022430 [Saccharomycopsis crataegensis]|uniref:Uncharacterized protein n=1 Tax=Saccharomycopsis crataegensis TaxID=43959 RepID=A0AAV5QL60_9ASCO|nr:hypothetical protein DASC09_022430 [Saccharomycopsis crataegensis]
MTRSSVVTTGEEKIGSKITIGEPSYGLINAGSIDKLAKIPDYPLDYNIYVFRKIKEAREKLTKEDLKDIIETVKLEDVQNHEDNKGYLTKTTEMHDRLLKYLTLERKRREKIILKKFLDDEISKSKKKSSEASTLDYKLQLTPDEEKGVLNYTIRSPIYNSFIKVDETTSEAVDKNINYKKLAMVQNIEYIFEEELNDDELVDVFADCNEFASFEVIYNNLRSDNGKWNDKHLINIDESKQDIRDAEIKEVLDKLMAVDIIRLLIPLAGQAVLTGIDVTRQRPINGK